MDTAVSRDGTNIWYTVTGQDPARPGAGSMGTAHNYRDLAQVLSLDSWFTRRTVADAT